MPTVRPATSSDLPAVGRALAAAFADDPVWQWLTQPSPTWLDRASRWFEADATSQMKNQSEVLVDDEVRGAAIWAAPGHWKASPTDIARILVPSLRLFRGRTVRALRLEQAMERAHLREEHWYLSILGTDPAHQGHGIGGALVSAVTARCDTEGMVAYLESSKEQNVPFYARFGFEVTDRFEHRDAPPMWLMRREPR